MVNFMRRKSLIHSVQLLLLSVTVGGCSGGGGGGDAGASPAPNSDNWPEAATNIKAYLTQQFSATTVSAGVSIDTLRRLFANHELEAFVLTTVLQYLLAVEGYIESLYKKGFRIDEKELNVILGTDQAAVNKYWLDQSTAAGAGSQLISVSTYTKIGGYYSQAKLDMKPLYS